MDKSSFLEKALNHTKYSKKEEYDLTKNLSKEEREEFFILNNLSFAKSVSHRYARKFKDHPRINEEDLFGAACKGLIDAARLFDIECDVKFISYAVKAIKHELLKYISQNSYICKLSRQNSAFLNKIKEFEQEYTEKHNASPSPFKIAEALSVQTYQVEIMMQFCQRESSIDDVVNFSDGEKNSFHEVKDLGQPFCVYTQLDSEDSKRILKEALSCLTEKEREIILARHSDDEVPLAEVGRKIKLTRQRIHQIYLNAMAKMRDYIHQNYSDFEYNF